MDSSKKRDLEIIYNLQWRNQLANGGDKSNIIGMYDIPATTLNWEVFKSYLLKNSGTAGDDVKVTYVTSDGKDFAIESQADFQIALYAFRRKARMSEMINLRLDKISKTNDTKSTQNKETQSCFEKPEAEKRQSNDGPPSWFTEYMYNFKKDMMEELNSMVTNLATNTRQQAVKETTAYYSRKSKRSRLHPVVHAGHEDNKMMKLKLEEKKLENKLEKLEHKTKRIMQRKVRLAVADDVEPEMDLEKSLPKIKQVTFKDPYDRRPQFDAVVINPVGIQHMLGGEIYLHQWEVENRGTEKWTGKTVLQFAWGSKAMRPLDSVVQCPCIKFGERGIISARLQIPTEPGRYDSYWRLVNDGNRFGHWLNCCIEVEPFDLKGHKSVLESPKWAEKLTDNNCIIINGVPEKYAQQGAMPKKYEKLSPPGVETVREEPKNYTYNIKNELVPLEDKPPEVENMKDVISKVEQLDLQDTTDVNSDSDNQSVASLSSAGSAKGFKDEFVLIPVPDCFKVGGECSSAVLDGVQNVQSNCYRVDSCDLFVDWPKKPEEDQEEKDKVLDLSKTSVEEVGIAEDLDENFDDNNNTEERESPNGSACKAETDAECSHKSSDMVMISLPSEAEETETGYAHIVVDGQKIQVPKKFIKSEYLELVDHPDEGTKSKTPSTCSIASSIVVVNEERPLDSPEVGTDESSVVTDAAGGSSPFKHSDTSLFSTPNVREEKPRLFVFPQETPGFEVVYPAKTPPSAPKLEQNRYDPYGPLEEHGPHPIYTTASTASSTAYRNTNCSPFFTPLEHVPNFQQSVPRPKAKPVTSNPSIPEHLYHTSQKAQEQIHHAQQQQQQQQPPVHILPETLVSGAVNVASSAINTARSVINMIVPPREQGIWVNGHWVSNRTDTPREANLRALAEMGFWDRDLNATLLARYKDDLARVVNELVQ